MIPLNGQGKPLPPDCGYNGEWLLENVLFLYRPSDQKTLGGGPPEITAAFQLPDGHWCIGFNAMQVASGLRIGSEEIFAANRNGTLIIDSIENTIPGHGATHAKRCIFRFGNRTIGLTIEGGTPSGNA
jgi:hypothetical protein